MQKRSLPVTAKAVRRPCMSIYSDLACEARELFPSVEGVEEQKEQHGEIALTRIEVQSQSAAEKLGKRRGRYITLDAPRLLERPLDLFEETAKRLAQELKAFIGQLDPNAEVMVVGLGNRMITPDSLGPRAAEGVYVTRHVKRYMPEAFEFPLLSVASIAPGVLGSTGVETLEAVKGLTERVKPDLIIAVDSLASRRAARISTTIQLSDAGIDPGSGVGNLRAGLNRDTLGVPVIAIGVPLVVYASTITQDTISLIADETGLHSDEEKLRSLAEKVTNEKLDGLIVTPKDIDSIVEDMSKILSKAINMALFGEHYEEVRMLIA